MKGRQISKLVRVGNYVAEVEVEMIDPDDGWSPYMSVEDACKLDDVRDALRRGDLKAATRLAGVQPDACRGIVHIVQCGRYLHLPVDGNNVRAMPIITHWASQ